MSVILFSCSHPNFYLITPLSAAAYDSAQHKHELGTAFKGPRQFYVETFRKHGIRGLFKGGVSTILRETPSYGVYFATYEFLCNSLTREDQTKDDLSWLQLLAAGGMSGIAGWISIYPIDVIKTRIQDGTCSPFFLACSHPPTCSPKFNLTDFSFFFFLSFLCSLFLIFLSFSFFFFVLCSLFFVLFSLFFSDPVTEKGKFQYTGIIDCAKQSYQEEGAMVFFRGLNATLVRAFPTNAVTLLVYTLSMRFLTNGNNNTY